jgi:chromosome segregation ATPase
MPQILGAGAVVIAILALGFAIGLRTQIARISRTLASDLEQLSRTLVDFRGQVDELRGQVDQLHGQVDGLRRELADLKAAAEVANVPPPPLPRARAGRLDDLREQLRASHRESESSVEE